MTTLERLLGEANPDIAMTQIASEFRNGHHKSATY